MLDWGDGVGGGCSRLSARRLKAMVRYKEHGGSR